MSKGKYTLGTKSLRNLIGVAPVMAFFVTVLIKETEQDFCVFEGVRSVERQKRLKQKGVSWTLLSRHLEGTAVDLVVWSNGKPHWESNADVPDINKAYGDIAKAAKRVIKKYDMPIDWGYDLWGKDLAHWQLNEHVGWDIRKIVDFKSSNSILVKLRD